ncbi:MAG TPA: hypothetical protein EYG99_02360 [Candidatus Pacebacteria bacterium]|nr:hypothetical protein [Candidatus Paceibacterota bacterium]
MRFVIENLSTNPVTALRRAGYRYQHKTDRGEMSFVNPQAQAGYPRFHMYVKLDGRNLHVSLHLDQKKHTYGNDTRHHGEYEESPALDQEAARIKNIVK